MGGPSRPVRGDTTTAFLILLGEHFINKHVGVLLRFYQIFKGLDTNSCLFKETRGSEACEPMSSWPLGPALTVLVPDSRPFVVPSMLTLTPFQMPLRAACVVVVPVTASLTSRPCVCRVVDACLDKTGKSRLFCELWKNRPCLFGGPNNLEHAG